MLIILKISFAEEMISYDVNSNSSIELLKEILKFVILLDMIQNTFVNYYQRVNWKNIYLQEVFRI